MNAKKLACWRKSSAKWGRSISIIVSRGWQWQPDRVTSRPCISLLFQRKRDTGIHSNINKMVSGTLLIFLTPAMLPSPPHPCVFRLCQHYVQVLDYAAVRCHLLLVGAVWHEGCSCVWIGKANDMKWPWALGSNPCTVIYGSQGDRRGVKTAYKLKLYICFLEPSNRTEPSSPGKKAGPLRAY